jgi:4-amino-4-deoxy-L-arabinose transferase-like glycosyltransferase
LALSFFSDKLSALLIFLLCVGTNYLQIVPANISSPHVYLFGFYAALLYLIHLWHKKPELNYSFLIGLLSALMILSRANELLFLMVPVLWLGWQFK